MTRPCSLPLGPVPALWQVQFATDRCAFDTRIVNFQLIRSDTKRDAGSSTGNQRDGTAAATAADAGDGRSAAASDGSNAGDGVMLQVRQRRDDLDGDGWWLSAGVAVAPHAQPDLTESLQNGVDGLVLFSYFLYEDTGERSRRSTRSDGYAMLRRLLGGERALPPTILNRDVRNALLCLLCETPPFADEAEEGDSYLVYRQWVAEVGEPQRVLSGVPQLWDLIGAYLGEAAAPWDCNLKAADCFVQ